MNAYYSGLGIARSLHGAGMQVYALTSERDVPGIRSRYFRGIYEVPNGRDEPERLRDRLLELRTSFAERPVLFPTRDFDVLFLHEYRDALAAAYVLPQPADSPIVRIMDKLELATVAEEQGIPTPTTMVCRSAAELEEAIPRLRFPVVMKPRFAYQWRRKGTWEKVGAKAIITQSADELRLQCRRLAELTPDIMLQEYVAGDDRDIVVCCCYVNREGKLLGYFTGRKLKQTPPLLGTGSIVEAADIPLILAPTLKLLKAFGYAGLAEVEFKYDADSGRYFLIEVNPRHWDQHELGTLVGVNLSRIAYIDMIGGTGGATIRPLYEPGRQYKWVAERELIYAIAQRVKRDAHNARTRNSALRASFRALLDAVRDAYGLLRGKRILATLKLGDPAPALVMCLCLLSEAFRSLAVGSDASGEARVGEVGKDGRL
jgi:predicted ATP-grasp superfamily ATP-dependent carboligase